MRLHMTKAHMWLHPAHMHVSGLHCPVCMVYFHSRARVLEHLMYKGKKRHCLHVLCLKGPALTYDEAVSMQQDTAHHETQLVKG
eukprot:4064944-Karenia_brevis.AAC.1